MTDLHRRRWHYWQSDLPSRWLILGVPTVLAFAGGFALAAAHPLVAVIATGLLALAVLALAWRL